ncbi:DUF6161 domain-containing protein [Mesorhizobium sp. WSM3859]|uniref:DUF6161 domain-containing protein n=1 Tax=Mesorhizobium sp. WSM3859 TaxID=2029402 RepID=UPI000BAF5ABB|nr:DUF6161 domain-containing protein [Mesorhizobium sp. WSM3859]PBC09178.1 hypothetical protein CK230_16985 [Mesorhizobium sp. WSM3859]
MDIADLRATVPEMGASNNDIQRVARLFGYRDRIFEGPHARAAADSAARDQEAVHRNLFARVSALATKVDNADVKSAVDSFATQYVAQVARLVRPNLVVQDSSRFIVASANRVPILTEEDTTNFMAAVESDRDSQYYQDWVALMVAAYVKATRFSDVQMNEEIVRTIIPSVRIATARLETYLMMTGTPEEFELPIAYFKARFGELSAQLDALSKAARAETENVAALQIRLETLGQYGTLFQEKTEAFETDFDNLRSAIEERLKLREATKLWGDTGRSAALAFYISGAILLLMLIAVPSGAFWFRAGILEFLKNIEATMIAGAPTNNDVAATVAALGRLVLITSPLGFVIWLIRLVVRYNTRSLLLMDDARQRVTMLNTYLFLIERDAAVKQDRGAILEALFRRAPGHGGDTVDAPHFTELLRYGQETAPKVN